MANLTYNGVSFGLVKTVSITQKPQRDPSNTDTLHWVYTLRVRSVVSVHAGGSYPSPNAGNATGPGGLMADLRHHLLRDRRGLRYVVGQEDVFNLGNGADAEAVDAANGPKVQACDVSQVTEGTFLIDWTVEVALADCDANVQKFASNRWEQSHDFDADGYLTISTSGTLYVRSDMKVNPDQLRGLVAPPIPDGFKRTASRYTLQRDGLALQYQFTDRQRTMGSPEGTTKAEFRLTLSTQPPGAVQYVQVDCTLTGKPGVSPGDLMAVAVSMSLSKIEQMGIRRLDNNNPASPPAVMAGSLIAEESTDTPISVHVSLRGQRNAGPLVSKPGGGFDLGRFAGRQLWKAAIPGAGPLLAVGGIVDAVTGEEDAADAAAVVARIAAQAQAAGQMPATLSGGGLETVFAVPEGLTAGGPGSDPSKAGGSDLLRMFGAAFKDPCVAELLKRAGRIGVGADDLPGVLGAEPVPVAGGGNGPRAGTTDRTLRTPAAVVEVTNTLRSVDLPAGLAGYDPFPGVYETWLCSVVSKAASNAFVLQATVKGVPAKVVKLGNDEAAVTVAFTAEKVGFPPEIPVARDTNLVHQKTDITSETVELAADGVSPVFKVSGVIKYAALDAAKVALRPPVAPWMDPAVGDVASAIPRSLTATALDATQIPPGTSTLRAGGPLPPSVNG